MLKGFQNLKEPRITNIVCKVHILEENSKKGISLGTVLVLCYRWVIISSVEGCNTLIYASTSLCIAYKFSGEKAFHKKLASSQWRKMQHRRWA
jgi:hypothetical protein